jgi:glycosyltransferase involved in cell wall biosynthesis
MRVTLGLLAYNHERFILAALRSVLSQTYSALQIIITDDASVDRTASLIQEEIESYKGPHHIEFYRNERNRGLSANINRHMELAMGELYVIAAGDDISYSNRVERLVDAFRRSGPTTMSLHSNGRKIDSNGNSLGLFFTTPPTAWRCKYPEDARAFHGVWVFGAAHGWSPRVFDFFGPLPEAIDYEDWVIPFRAGLIGNIVYIDDVLVDYRLHDSNLWFGSNDLHSNSYKWRAGKLKHVANEIRVIECKEMDLSVAYAKLPALRATVISLQHANERACENAKASRELLQGGVGFWRKIKLALSYCVGEKSFKQKVYWIMTHCLQSLYIWYVRIRGSVVVRQR